MTEPHDRDRLAQLDPPITSVAWSSAFVAQSLEVQLVYLAHDGAHHSGRSGPGLASGGQPRRSVSAWIGVAQVLEHAFRHLSWLVKDDAVVGEALADWVAFLNAYEPEPFRAFGPPRTTCLRFRPPPC